MCEAFENERRMIANRENRLIIEGFNTARLGKKRNPSLNSLVNYKFEREAWKHGYSCFLERLLPWAIERGYHIGGNAKAIEKISKQFKATGKLPEELVKRLGN